MAQGGTAQEIANGHTSLILTDVGAEETGTWGPPEVAIAEVSWGPMGETRIITVEIGGPVHQVIRAKESEKSAQRGRRDVGKGSKRYPLQDSTRGITRSGFSLKKETAGS